MRSLITHCTLIISLLAAATALHAQRPPVRSDGSVSPAPQNRPGTQGTQAGQPGAEQSDVDEFRDTFGVFYFYADNPRQETPYADSLLGNDLQQYDPARRRGGFDYQHLGILGSAARPMYYEPTQRRGFDVGLRQFDIYQTTANTLPYYRLEKAYTNFSYALGSEQADGYITTAFSRNFANGVNFTVDYKRLSQLGRVDQYPNQNTRTNALGMGLWYQSQDGRYEAFGSFISNSVEQEDNGGVLEEPDAEGALAGPGTARTALTDAQTRHGHRQGNYTHYYRFGGKIDSLGQQRRAFTLAHHFSYQQSEYKFFNEQRENDSTFYAWHPVLLPDDRGTRFFLQHRQVENSLRLATYKLADGKASNTAREQQDRLEVGLVHNWHALSLEPIDTSIQTLFLTGQWDIKLRQLMRLETYAHLGLLGMVGDYRLGGRLLIDLRKAGKLELKAVNQLYSPNLMQSRLYLTQREVWNNPGFRQTLETSLQAAYELPLLGIRIGGGYHLLNNYIYFDSTALPRQTALPLSIAQLSVEKSFRIWRIHLDNLVGLQVASEDVIRLPGLLGKHSLYYEGRWFGSLDVRLGFDVRYNDAYLAPYYNPATGQFQLQDRQRVDFYPNVDAFFSMRVTSFRAFAKMENINTWINNNQLFYQTAYYPFPNAAFRFGIRWRLVG